jgi:methyl-accepting chemotaxis protein
MKQTLGIGGRLGFVIFGALLVTIALFAGSGIWVQVEYARATERKALDNDIASVKVALEAEARRAASLAALVAALPPVIDAMRAEDRKALFGLLGPVWDRVKGPYALEQMQFHKPPAISFLRVNQPAKFGDDLSAFRATVVKANKERKPVMGLEKGVTGLGIRGVVPIGGDEALGSVEFGTSFGKDFFDNLKEVYGFDVTLLTRNAGGEIKAFASTLEGGSIGSNENIAKAFAGERGYETGSLQGKPVASVIAPVSDFGGNVAGVLEIVADRTDFTTALDRMIQIAMFVSFLALLGGAGILVLINRMVSRPVKALTATMKRMADGDLAAPIALQDRTDELGHMIQAVRVFKEGLLRADRLAAEQQEAQRQREERTARLSGLISSFDSKAGTVIGAVAAAATQMHGAAQSMAGTASTTQHEASSVANTTRHAAANIQAVASAAEELTSSIREIGRQMEESAHVSNEASEQAARTQGQVKNLAQAAAKIGEVVGLINDIAAQTNLLALNATIEAARAGEAGKGFAVVAGEVKNLAGQTARATGEIEEQVNEVQAATSSAVAAIDAIVDRITALNGIAATIATAVEEQGAATAEIARNVQEVAAGTRDVASGVDQLSGAAEQAGRSSDEVLHAAAILSHDAADLKSFVQSFLEGVRKA